MSLPVHLFRDEALREQTSLERLDGLVRVSLVNERYLFRVTAVFCIVFFGWLLFGAMDRSMWLEANWYEPDFRLAPRPNQNTQNDQSPLSLITHIPNDISELVKEGSSIHLLNDKQGNHVVIEGLVRSIEPMSSLATTDKQHAIPHLVVITVPAGTRQGSILTTQKFNIRLSLGQQPPAEFLMDWLRKLT